MNTWPERARRLKTEMVALSLALGIAVKFVPDAVLVVVGVAVAL